MQALLNQILEKRRVQWIRVQWAGKGKSTMDEEIEGGDEYKANVLAFSFLTRLSGPVCMFILWLLLSVANYVDVRPNARTQCEGT
ncbi:unnamed protein product [Cercopithifilaria johnstoni]|uniref:Uncharacterized protein n=1 Tax=Cercopithifilaria johnstoni TaxID=2874296 RepID=A0A8J2PPL1_9BILA|nr:unnamed protein product [Cercopithifilaria johnstoni]